MPRGRPIKSRIAPWGHEGPWREVLVLSTNDRLPISADVSRRRLWLAPGKELLAVLNSGRSISLLPYADKGAQVEKQMRSIEKADEALSEAEELALHTRYLRLRVDSDSRVRLPKDARVCLGLDPIAPVCVSVTLREEEVTLEPAETSDYAFAEELLSDFDIP